MRVALLCGDAANINDGAIFKSASLTNAVGCTFQVISSIAFYIHENDGFVDVERHDSRVMMREELEENRYRLRYSYFQIDMS